MAGREWLDRGRHRRRPGDAAGRALAALLLLALAAGVHSGGLASPLLPRQVYQVDNSDGTAVLVAPGASLAEQPDISVISQPTLGKCAQACTTILDCVAFEYCDVQDGCRVLKPALEFQECRLTGSNCTLIPLVLDSGPFVKRTAGFPVRHVADSVPGYATAVAQVLDTSGSFSCPGSVLDGQCAFRRLRDAVSVCSTMEQCKSFVHYFNGTDGCSEEVVVLSKASPADTPSYVAPSVDVGTKTIGAPTAGVLAAGDGTVIAPTPADLAAAANSSDPTTWLGCIVAPGALMDGDLVEVLSSQPTPEACCRACRANPECKVWNYCARPEGCSCSFNASSPISGPLTVSLAQGQCELRYQSVADPESGWPPVVLAKGANVPLTSGAPMAVWVPPQPGYRALPGRLLFDYGAYPCNGSIVSPELGECALIAPPEEQAALCDANPQCIGVVYKPVSGDPAVPVRIGILKNKYDATVGGLSPTDILFLKDSWQPNNGSGGSGGGGESSSSSGGGGLSVGAVAGIVVAACVGAAALAVATWAALRRRRRRQRGQGGDDLKADEGGAISSSTPEGSRVMPLHSGTSTPKIWAVSAQQVAAAAAAAAAAAERPSTLGSGQTASPFASHGSASASAAHNSQVPRAGGSRSGSRDGALPQQPTAMRASWDAQPALSPFAAQSATPFASGAATPLGLGGSRASRGGSLVTALGPEQSAAVIAAAEANAPGQRTTAGSSTPAAASNHGSSSSHGGSDPLLPELARHVAECDAALSTDPAAKYWALVPHAIVSADNLPASLRGSVVDVSEISYLTWPSGRLQEIGTGASATVYKAVWAGEIVAAKEIDIGRSPAMQEAFITEALRLHQLHHPHVVALLGVAICGSTGILLMEYCAGRDLRSALMLTVAGTEERLFGWARRGRRVAIEISRALSFLHARGVVHMDVKSSNVLLTGGGTAKLADVGLARMQTGTHLSDVPLIGTFAWIAPEVLMGGKGCTSAVDIYSFGVVLWEIVTGERPQRGALRMPRVPEECPQDVCDLLMECLSLEPSQRPTAQQVVRRLESERAPLDHATAVPVAVRLSRASGNPSSGGHGSASSVPTVGTSR